MATLTLGQLSAEDREQLKKEALADEQAKADKQKEDRKAYKALVNETVPDLFRELIEASKLLSTVKKKVFDGLAMLVVMKSDVYGASDDQATHSFTTETGERLQIGYRVTDDWDDTVTAGLAKVYGLLESMGKDENSKKLVKAVLRLLAKDEKGNLKSSRVLQLKKMADDFGDAALIDAIAIIQDAYRPVRTNAFVTAAFKNNASEWEDLALDITAAAFEFALSRPVVLNGKHEQKAETAQGVPA